MSYHFYLLLAGIALLFVIHLHRSIFQKIQTYVSYPVSVVYVVVSSASATVVCLVGGVSQPFSPGGILSGELPERMHRGWPFAWFGLVGLEQIFFSVLLALNTLFWAAVSCFVLAYVVRFGVSAKRITGERILIGLSFVLVLISSLGLSLVLPPHSIWSWP